MKWVLCVVAHPDDEVLGVGGTLARHVLDGDTVHVIIVCQNSFRQIEGDVRQQTVDAMRELGVQSWNCLEYHDQLLEEQEFQQIVQKVRKNIPFVPDVIYTHWHKDLNRDHRIVNEVVQLIARPIDGRKFILLEFPTPSSTEYSRETFTPDTWVDIASSFNRKVRAMECYKTEIQDVALPRNAAGLHFIARVTGGQVGLVMAESFCTVRRVR